MSEAIVVTGVGAVCPLGTGASAVWAAFAAGESGVRKLGPDDERVERGVDPCPAAEIGLAGWVRGFRPRDHIRSPQLRRMDWCSRMLIAAMRQAFEDSGALPLDAEGSQRTALVVGSCYGNQRETAAYLDRVLPSPAAGQPMLFPNLVLNAAAGYAAIELDVQGPNLCVAEHEASGEAALAAAVDLLRSGACDVVCAGGVDELGAVQVDALADLRLLCRDSLPEARRGRAGAGGRAAIVPGEGAAALVLESESRARARGARTYASLAAARVGAVPAAPYLYPSDAGAAADRLLSLAAAPGPPIDGVVGGASGLPARDRIDEAVVRRLSEQRRGPVGYARFKRLVGDWGSAGALGAVLATLALEHGRLPGTTEDTGAVPASAPALDAPRRILVIGAARGGVVIPVLLDRHDAVPRRER